MECLPVDKVERLQLCRELLAEAGREGLLRNSFEYIPAICNDIDDSIMRLKREKAAIHGKS